VFWYRLVMVAKIAFQACSIDHSDISPFRINDLRVVLNSVTQNPASNVAVRKAAWIQQFTDAFHRGTVEIV